MSEINENLEKIYYLDKGGAQRLVDKSIETFAPIVHTHNIEDIVNIDQIEIEVDTNLSSESNNPVANSAIVAGIDTAINTAVEGLNQTITAILPAANEYTDGKIRDTVGYVDEQIAGHTHSFDDLEDKPFGEETGETELLSVTREGDKNATFVDYCSLVLVEGETYTVTLDGLEPTQHIAQKNSDGKIYLNSDNLDSGNTDNYVIIYDPQTGQTTWGFTIDDVSPRTLKVYGEVETVKTLDEKYIPDTIARTENVDAEFDKLDTELAQHMGNTSAHLTDNEKVKIEEAYTHITEGHAPIDAEKNVIVGITRNGEAVTVSENRIVDIVVPTTAEEIGADPKDSAKNALAAAKTYTDNSVSGFQIHVDDDTIHFTAAEREKLAGIQEGANFYEPEKLEVSAGTYTKVTITENGHVVSGSNPTTLEGYGITDAISQEELTTLQEEFDRHKEDTSHLTSEDRTKLDGIESGANKYIHPTSGVSTGTYTKVTVDEYGHVTGASSPTTLEGYGITDGATEQYVTETEARINENITNAIKDLASTNVVDTKVSNHNVNTEAHNDIRALITELSTKVNHFLDVDEATSDELSEVLAMIKANEGTIESLIENKISTEDIVTNLTTNSNTKVAAASTVVALKGLIEALDTELDNQVASLNSAISGKAPNVHTHAIADVTNLQTTLDNKADDGHKHAGEDITSGTIPSDRLPTVPVAKGGTGATTTHEAQYNLLADMNAGSSAVTDDSLFTYKYASPSTTNGAMYTRTASTVWTYIKDKISSVLGLTASDYSGNAATATTATESRSSNILKKQALLQTQSDMDAFLNTDGVQYTLFEGGSDATKFTDFYQNEGMLLSIPWNTNYGAQLAFDDTRDGNMFVRGKAETWGAWNKVLHSNNYTDYAATKDHSHDYIDKVDPYYLGNMSGKTITDLRTAIKNWMSSKSSFMTPNAIATFAADTNWITLWNAENTTSTINDGSMWTIEAKTFYDGGVANYALLEFRSYYDKYVYYVALSNNSWKPARRVGFMDEVAPLDHTHKYAGSDSAGGAATKTKFSLGNGNTYRYIPFQQHDNSSSEFVAHYDADFTYNPDTNTLKVGATMYSDSATIQYNSDTESIDFTFA